MSTDVVAVVIVDTAVARATEETEQEPEEEKEGRVVGAVGKRRSGDGEVLGLPRVPAVAVRRVVPGYRQTSRQQCAADVVAINDA